MTALNKPRNILLTPFAHETEDCVDSFNPTTKTQQAISSAAQAATMAGNPHVSRVVTIRFTFS